MASNRDFVSRKVHSLLGVVPIGLFLIVHLTVNYFAVRGAAAFNKASNFMESLPYLFFLEILLIYVPIIFHAVYGVYIAFQAKNNVQRFGFFRNWMFFLQRWSGIILLIFISWHVWETRIAHALGQTLNFNMMANILDNPGMIIFYIVGVVATIFHFCNGLWSFSVSWGITVTPRSQHIMTYVTLVIFVLLTIVGIKAIFAFTNPELAFM